MTDNNAFCLKIAGIPVEIRHTYDYVRGYCGKYLTEETPALSVSLTEDDMAWETEENRKTGELAETRNIESLAIQRKLCESLLSFSTFLMHGAVIALDTQTSFMFTAKSGTGKTTHIRKWLENAPGAFVVNGDKPLIKITDTEAIAYGTPWCGKEHLNTNIGVPLRAIVLMERSEDNEIEEITFSQAFPTLLQQTYRPADADKMRKTLSLLSALNGKMKFYRFRFNNMKADAFCVSYEALIGKRL